MPDMTNAEAAKWLNNLLDHSLIDHDSIEAKAVMVALAALTPKTDENGHALCGCGGKGIEQINSEGRYQISCKNKCGSQKRWYSSSKLAWGIWDDVRAMGLRRDA